MLGFTPSIYNPSYLSNIYRIVVKVDLLNFSLQRSDMSIEGDASNSRAPAERNVYSKSMSTPNPKAPAGRYVYRISAT